MNQKSRYESPVIVRYGSITGITGNTTLACSTANKIGSNSDDVTHQTPSGNQVGTWTCV